MSGFLCDNQANAKAAIRYYTLLIENSEKPNDWNTWGCGLAMVTATAFAAAIAILFTPLISRRVYNRLLAFLIALGVGNLTGCTLFVLFPRVFHISQLGTNDYMTKSWMALGGCYLLFVFEKVMDFFGEVKKKRKIKISSHGRHVLVEQRIAPVETPPAFEIHEGPPGIILEDEISQASSVIPQMPTIKVPINNHILTRLSPRNLRQGKRIHLPSFLKPMDDKPTESELQSEALLALLGGWANNLIDGMTLGVSFGDSPIRGLTIGLAILSQQFPNEVDSLVIVMNTGVGLKRALLLNLVQAALSYIGFVTAVIIDNNMEQFDSFLYAVAAGNYLYICIGCLVPVMSEKLVASVKVGVKEGLLTTILQFSGIIIGHVFMFFMALEGKDIPRTSTP